MKSDNKIEISGKMHIALEMIEGCRKFAQFIPEVKTNLVYAGPEPESPEDIMGIEGRITAVNGVPHATGRPKFGASSHMARLIIEMNKYNSEIRAGINFKNNPQIVAYLEEYCRKKDWVLSVIDRSREPEEIKKREGVSMSWKVQEAVRAAKDKIPKVFYETGAVGKEPVTVLVGKDPIQVSKEVCELVRGFKKEDS